MTEHILFIIDGLPGGGAENVTLSLAKGLHKQGYIVSILSLAERRDYEIPSGVNYFVSPDNYQGCLKKINEVSRRARAMDSLLQKIFFKLGQPDLIISSLHKTDRIVSRSRLLQKMNVWHCIHGIFSQSYLGNKSGLKRLIKKKKIQCVYNKKNIICVSDAVGKDLVDKVDVKPKKIITIYNPFDFNEIREKSQAPSIIHEESYILHVGRFHNVKRHDRLLHAFAIANLPTKLVLLGKGDDKKTNEIKEKISSLNIQDKVILAGFKDNPLPEIKNSRMVVLSSDSEGLPTVLIESLICHTPVVSTHCPGGVSEIMNGKLSIYMSELTAESLAEKMTFAWFNPPHITQEMYNKFNSANVIKKYLSLIEKSTS
ncbi:glycosyltransferase [Edwardsiella hoshinae]|uniref:Mannosylfructose-phosphate synthase n=1 Tax=Edwardsiella hoshinae TaxID=93378 RepID=A0A376DN58_9GAMM|nr:glycosyltransferase [Edwardsiella hoshinae]QPR28767.1 glycosyltransferase [Edwardsiella hoshinae]STC92215.1 Mannosylfructose-phosphate synthase [Edwardsiella hoshinae]